MTNAYFTYEKINSLSNQILEKANDSKQIIGIICDSGLGGIGDLVQNPIELPYSNIPKFPHSTGKHLS